MWFIKICIKAEELRDIYSDNKVIRLFVPLDNCYICQIGYVNMQILAD